MIPTISHPTDRPNFSVVTIGDRTYYFSYRTCIGYHDPDTGLIARVNEWGPTTGRHLNHFTYPDTPRLTADQFRARIRHADESYAFQLTQETITR